MIRSFRDSRVRSMVSAIALLAGGVATGLLSAAPADAMTLNEAVAYAVETNPEIGQARSNREAVDFELRQARGLYLPQIDLEADVGPEWANRDRAAEDEQWRVRRRLSVVLQQMIFDGFATDAEVERQAARVDAAAHRVLERAEFVGLDVVQAYLDVMRQIELVDLARDNIAVHQQTLSNVRQRTDAGRSSTADVQQTDERLRNAENLLIDAETSFELSRLAYQRLVGLPAADFTLPTAPDASLPAGPDVAVETAFESNPTLKLAGADLDTTYAEYKAAEANFYPTLSIEGGASTQWDTDGVKGDEQDARALLVLRYNLYRGGIDSANREEQVRRIDQTRHALLQFEREVEELVRQTWVEYQAAQRRQDILQQQLLISEQVRNSYSQQFTIGQRTLLDLLDSENELYNTRVSLTTTRYAELFAKYRVLASMGQLLPTLEVTPPAQARADARSGAGVPETPASETMSRRADIPPFDTVSGD